MGKGYVLLLQKGNNLVYTVDVFLSVFSNLRKIEVALILRLFKYFLQKGAAKNGGKKFYAKIELRAGHLVFF